MMSGATRGIGLVVASLLLGAVPAAASDKQGEELIERLLEITEPGFGYSMHLSGSEFLPYAGSGQMDALVIGAARATPSPTLRAIVAKGAEIVPVLLAHIGDARTIKMKPVSGMMWIDFADEYDFNRRTRTDPPKGVNRTDSTNVGNRPEHHAITIGDLCFVALGQIVNRQFAATRYQPTGGLIVSSPTFSPALRQQILADWGGLTRQRHEDQLTDDFLKPDDPQRRIGTYWRLACYYPEAVEPLVLQALAEPTYDWLAVHRFISDQLYRVTRPGARKRLFDTFLARHGEPARQGVLLALFDDLAREERELRSGLADLDVPQTAEQRRASPTSDRRTDARACLVDLYGYSREVASTDRPPLFPVTNLNRAGLIRALTHDHSQKIRDVVQEIFLKSPEDQDLAPACLTALANRGCGPFLIKQLNKIAPGEVTTNRLHLHYLESISQSREPDVRDKLLEFVKATRNDEYFMAALPAIDRAHDPLVLKLACEVLAVLPADTDRGERMLEMIGRRFPDRARQIFQSFLASGSARRAETMCKVLWYGHPLALEILPPLLDDKRSLSGFSHPMRVCDRAATAISQACKGIPFDSDWSTAKKDQAIDRLKRYCRQKSQK